MAKEKQSNLDDLPSLAKAPEKPQTAPSPEPEPPKAMRMAIKQSLIEVPLLDNMPKNWHAKRRLDIRLRGDEAYTLKQIVMGLQDGAGVLKDGHPIQNSSDAIRWMLQQCGG